MRHLIQALPFALLAVLVSFPVRAGEPAANDPANAALEKLLQVSKADAARIRGLSFLAPVPVRRIDRAGFLAITLRDLNRVFGKGEDLEGMDELLHLLGVLPEGKSLLGIVKRFFPSTVAAKYDPFEKEIVFLPGFGSRSTMVHELTHALQDQHFDLKRMFGAGAMTFDRLLALGALVEGDAEDVQRNFDTKGLLSETPLRVIATMGRTQVKRYLERMKAFPPALARPFIFQYLDGLLFVETVKRARHGFAGLDAVYRDPPETTEQILHPEKYLARDRDRPTRISVPKAPAGYHLRISNVLGELGLSIVLRQALGPDYDPAAAEGWDGDRIVLYENAAGAPLWVWLTTFDTVRDAGEFRDAAEAMFRVRFPARPIRGRPSLRIQTGPDGTNAILTSGRDVLLAGGLPAKGLAGVLANLTDAEKTELREVRTAFGRGR